MVSDSVWIVGSSRSGKTTRLAWEFCHWVQIGNQHTELFYTKKPQQQKYKNTIKTSNLRQTEPGVLVLAANDDNRRVLSDQIVALTSGKYPIRAKTTLGFIQDEVILFWPLLIESLQIKAQFPVRLRPETEQELATKLWRSQLDAETLQRAGVNEYRLVRRILDLWQLAAYSGTSCEEIVKILQTGLEETGNILAPEFFGSLLLNWRNWCLERGFLTYALITELYNHHLLTNSNYQQRLMQRYQRVIADDVDDYPAIARNLFEFLLDNGAIGAFSYNSEGAVRWGLGADSKYLQGLAKRCRVENLVSPTQNSLAYQLTTQMVELITEPMAMLSLPKFVQSIQTGSRAQLLRATAEEVIGAIKSGIVAPEEVAIIAPGLDAIARYTLIEILTKQNILVESLNDQLPLISSPEIRALLTLLALVYPGLGRLVDRDEVAEMLVVLSRKKPTLELETVSELSTQNTTHSTDIDPVRAGLIADYCFVPHPDNPHLLEVKTFERWDRIGYAASKAYGEILQWIEQQRSQLEEGIIASPISLLYLAIQHFLCQNSSPPYQQLAALRELLETAQHYWEVDTRLKPIDLQPPSSTTAIAEFIQLLRRGTITANPYPLRPIGNTRKAVTLATIFQYRASRRNHKWHFWLDAGSPLWAKGGAATLYGAPLFLRDRLGQPWTAADEQEAETQRLRRIIADLLARVSQRIYLCHSNLAVNGQEQLGPLLPLVHASGAVNIS
ncbi:recombinase family protein [Sphaerospermopsis aphanizomenoides BCCUSP55]|uniref:recombinase family protein n=1 Tax=Sphaerospermopsis aphanizomenoides TaxID=459663 RepID=UPI000ACFB703|nr:recombinase family protein [Sphaerospermopsis aphanizomenoides]MBK1986566.1 recombinase family protein [Sphaerospermopsis aphanizomenoides BCCUSP55]